MVELRLQDEESGEGARARLEGLGLLWEEDNKDEKKGNGEDKEEVNKTNETRSI